GGRRGGVAGGGGGPGAVRAEVFWGDFAPEGSSLGVVREMGGANRLDFPIDKPLYQTAGWISHPRVSPDAKRVAFLEHPILNDDGGSVAVVDLAGKKRTVAAGYATVWGVASTPVGREASATASRAGG